MLGEEAQGEEAEPRDLEEEQAGPHPLDAEGAGALQRPEAADDEQRVERVGAGEVGELALRQQDALQGHAAGVREEGAAEPRGQALHLVHNLGRVGEEAGEEARDEAGEGRVEPADAQADEDQPPGHLVLSVVGVCGDCCC